MFNELETQIDMLAEKSKKCTAFKEFDGMMSN